MATGSGKTTVMALLAVWSILNRQANRGDGRFSECGIPTMNFSGILIIRLSEFEMRPFHDVDIEFSGDRHLIPITCQREEAHLGQ